MDIESVEGKLLKVIGNTDSYATWKNPGENILHVLRGKSVTLNSVRDLGKHSGFAIAPFCLDEDYKVVIIEHDCRFESIKIDVPECLKARNSTGCPGIADLKSLSDNEPDSVYMERFGIFHSAVSNGRFEKLVLSRNKSIKIDKDFSALKAFYTACIAYGDSYIYLCNTPYTGIWIGATPEVLLSVKGTNCTTVALAGTKLCNNNLLPDKWDSKNIAEQNLVANYLRNIVRNFDPAFKEDGPYPVKAGKLTHLKTVFEFRKNRETELGGLLELIHPTPAVCGLPKREALGFILENEGYSRGYYSGFVGKLNIEKETQLYVNLRCMNICDNVVTLYAGGGIVKESVAEDEWIETERKMATMQDLLFD